MHMHKQYTCIHTNTHKHARSQLFLPHTHRQQAHIHTHTHKTYTHIHTHACIHSRVDTRTHKP